MPRREFWMAQPTIGCASVPSLGGSAAAGLGSSEEGTTMTAQQGDPALLNDPVAQELLQSRIPARLAYTWPDGTPRVVPIWFHWTGEEVVMGGPPDAPKMHALQVNPAVALTI